MFQRIAGVLMLQLLANQFCIGQNMRGKLDMAIQKLSTDNQFKHAITSLYVIDSKTGAVVFDRNSQLGLAPASCQKVITSTSAFELLGKNFRFKTYIGYSGKIENGQLKGSLYLTGQGDPALGSERWSATSEEKTMQKIMAILQKNKIRSVTGDLVCNDAYFTSNPVPAGWVWEDIGNYYGAGAWGLNWRENQFDVTFKTGKTANDSTLIISTVPSSIMTDHTIANFVKTGEKGSGDNGYLFSSPFQQNIVARGTVPPSTGEFTISGSMPDPPQTFIRTCNKYLKENGIQVAGEAWSSSGRLINNQRVQIPVLVQLDSILSPSLDSINYWFLKKSVNLFGEALVKMIGFEKAKSADTDAGIDIIQAYWDKSGIERSSIRMIDGSGLSPANRITTHSLVTVLQYASKQPWFGSFYNALPETHGIKMKDGYITGVRSYTGYIKSKSGTAYTFAFIVNNFDGGAGTVREKMWKVLDVLMDN